MSTSCSRAEPAAEAALCGDGDSTKTSHYDILSICQTASPDEIKKAYRKLSLRWHPDKNPSNNEEAKRRFNDISTAYQILSNPRQRVLNDRKETDSSHNGCKPGGTSLINGDLSASAADDVDADVIFKLRDARVVFREFFGGRDPFSEGFGIPVSEDLSCAVPAVGLSAADCSRLSSGVTVIPPRVFRHISVNGDREETPSGFSTMTTNTTTVKSVATATRFVHGKKIVTRKVVENGNETTTIEEDGVLKSRTVNGIPVGLPVPGTMPPRNTDTVTSTGTSSRVADPLLNPPGSRTDHIVVADIASQLHQVSINHKP